MQGVRTGVCSRLTRPACADQSYVRCFDGVFVFVYCSRKYLPA